MSQHFGQRRLSRHPLFSTLFSLKGNPRACIYTEPLWSIPHSLYQPFAGVFMSTLGLTDGNIGTVLSIGLILQVFFALIGGVLTDKLGRRLATFIFDTVSWSIPCLLWAFSQNFWWFAIAAAINALWQIPNISWNCLMVEDAPSGDIVNIYTWTTVSGLIAVFFAPISGMLVSRFTLVPAVRTLYLFSFVMMTAKFLLCYLFTTETAQGKIRLEETKGVSIFSQFAGYKDVFFLILKSKKTLLMLAILVLLNINTLVTNNFFGIYIKNVLGIPAEYLAYYPIGRAIIMLVFIFTLQAFLNRLNYKIPMLIGIFLYITAHGFLVAAPHTGAEKAMVIGYVICEAFAFSLVVPRRSTMLVHFVDPKERSRILSLLFVITLGIASPFGAIIGRLSDLNRTIPFCIAIGAFIIMGALIAFTKPDYPEGTQQGTGSGS